MLSNEELNAIKERCENATEDIPKLLSEIDKLRNRLDDAEGLLEDASDLLDDMYIHETEIAVDITDYFAENEPITRRDE